MHYHQKQNAAPESLIATWLKSATDFWMSTAQVWSQASAASNPSEGAAAKDKSRSEEALQSALKIAQVMFLAMSQPGTADALARGIGALPEVVLKMAQTTWDGYFYLQQQWLERSANIGRQTEAYKFEELDQQMFQVWNDIYEKNFKQYLNIPQLGLTRSYQERMARTADELNQYQAAMAEFIYVLYLPVEKSTQVLQKKLEEDTREGNLSENFKEYYNVWIKSLEGHYMTLFKSAEYTRSLSKLLHAAQGFKAARQEVLIDLLGNLPIPTNKEMDELYKELYLLKKKVRELEKRANLRGASA
jgi:polyhydroxyalkanoate synthase subunit PhaE